METPLVQTDSPIYTCTVQASSFPPVGPRLKIPLVALLVFCVALAHQAAQSEALARQAPACSVGGGSHLPVTVRQVDVGVEPSIMVMSPLTHHIFVAGPGPCGAAGQLVTLDDRNGTVLRRAPVPIGTGFYQALLDEKAHSLAFDDGPAYPDTVYLVDTRTGAVADTVPMQGGVVGMALDQRSHHLFVAVQPVSSPADRKAGVRPHVVAISLRGDRTLWSAQPRVGAFSSASDATYAPIVVDLLRHSLYASGKRGIAVLDEAGGQRERVLHVGACRGNLALSMAGDRLYTASAGEMRDRYNAGDLSANPGGSFCVIDPRRADVIRRYAGGPGSSAHILAVDSHSDRVLMAWQDQMGPGHAELLGGRHGDLVRSLRYLSYPPTPYIDSSADAVYFFANLRSGRPATRPVGDVRCLSPDTNKLSMVLQGVPVLSALAASRRAGGVAMGLADTHLVLIDRLSSRGANRTNGCL